MTVATRGLPPLRFTLESYSPDSVEVGALTLRIPAPEGLTLGQVTPLDIALTVRGSKPCAYPPLSVTTLSPDVCLGPGDESSWSEIAAGVVRIRPIAAGVCRLTVGATGAAQGTDVQIEYRAKP